MRKIPTLFKRVYDGHKIVDILPEVTPGMEWVLEWKGTATLKFDGACCAIINGEFYKRYDANNGKKIPEGAIKCQDESDPVTGHFPCWVKVEKDNPSDKWFVKAFERFLRYAKIEDGTYEAVGQHFQGNPYGVTWDTLVKHGTTVIDVERSFEGIKSYLRNHYIEGIVFWLDGEPKCKIKRSDFGFRWNGKRKGDDV